MASSAATGRFAGFQAISCEAMVITMLPIEVNGDGCRC